MTAPTSTDLKLKQGAERCNLSSKRRFRRSVAAHIVWRSRDVQTEAFMQSDK
jgi:hypothetical protein